MLAALDALRAVLARLGELPEPDQLCAQAAQEAAAFFDAPRCLILLVDEDRGPGAAAYAAGLNGAESETWRAGLATYLATRADGRPEPAVRRRREPEHDRGQAEGSGPGFCGTARPGAALGEAAAWLYNDGRLPGEGAALVTRLGTETRASGALRVAREPGGRPFAQQDVLLLAFFAGQLGLMIENLRLAEREQAARHLAATLMQLPQVVRPVTSPERDARAWPAAGGGSKRLSGGAGIGPEVRAVLNRLLRLLRQALACRGASAGLLDGGRLRSVAGHGYSGLPDVTGESREVRRNAQVISMIDSGGAAYVPDTADEPAWQAPPQRAWVRSWIGAPIWTPGSRRDNWPDLIGVLSVDDDRPGAFTLADVALAQTFADQMAIALENAWLSTALKELPC